MLWKSAEKVTSSVVPGSSGECEPMTIPERGAASAWNWPPRTCPGPPKLATL